MAFRPDLHLETRVIQLPHQKDNHIVGEAFLHFSFAENSESGGPTSLLPLNLVIYTLLATEYPAEILSWPMKGAPTKWQDQLTPDLLLHPLLGLNSGRSLQQILSRMYSKNPTTTLKPPGRRMYLMFHNRCPKQVNNGKSGPKLTWNSAICLTPTALPHLSERSAN